VRERGSVLMLMPAAVLVFVVLGALVVDAALVYRAEREVASLAAAAANDAAGAAVDLNAWYLDGTLVLTPAVASSVAADRVAGGRFEAQVVDVRVDGDRVTVVVGGRADHLFADAIPGARGWTEVEASATATAIQG
jgi:hypothetical protein